MKVKALLAAAITFGSLALSVGLSNSPDNLRNRDSGRVQPQSCCPAFLPDGN